MEKKRGNGTGSVYKLPSGKWRGAVTLGQWIDENGKVHRQVVSKNFENTRGMGDRLPLIGHANEKTLHHYADIDLDGLREITDLL